MCTSLICWYSTAYPLTEKEEERKESSPAFRLDPYHLHVTYQTPRSAGAADSPAAAAAVGERDSDESPISRLSFAYLPISLINSAHLIRAN